LSGRRGLPAGFARSSTHAPAPPKPSATGGVAAGASRTADHRSATLPFAPTILDLYLPLEAKVPDTFVEAAELPPIDGCTTDCCGLLPSRL